MPKLMVVDDERLMADGICAMLAGIEDLEIVARVCDAREVLAVARRELPDLIIQDVLMNTGSGRALTSQVRKALPGTRVIGCSTSTAPRVIEEMLRAGASGYVTKNEPEGTLETAVRHVLTQTSVYMSPRTIESMRDPNLSIASLSEREREVLGFLCRDIIPKQVADEMGISVKTVYNHMERIRLKAGVNNIIQLYALAVQEGIIELPG